MKLEISTSELPDISSGPAALTVARAQVADLLHFEEHNENRAFRFQAYRQVTLWAHGKLGRRAAKIIPAYCTVAIRNKYPDPEGKYKVFFWLQKKIISKFYFIIIVFISSKTEHKCSIPNTYYKIAWDLSVNKIGC